MKPTVQPAILEAAIHLFGLHSFHGVTTKQLAKEAKVVEGSIYNLFEDKKSLYLQAVTAVIQQANQEFAKFVAVEFKSQDFSARRLENSLHIWASALPRPVARLLMQVMISDDRLTGMAREPLEQMIGAIANSLDRQKKGRRKFNSKLAARTLIRALLWAKVEHANGAEAERDLTETLQQWLACVEAG